MTDIVERLREYVENIRGENEPPENYLCGQAANEIDRLRKDADVALWEATRLLESFVAQHFPSNADWKPQPDLVGVILQLSNAVVITRDYKAEIDMAKKMIERQDKEIKQLRVIADDGAVEIEHLRSRLAVLEAQWLRLRELMDE